MADSNSKIVGDWVAFQYTADDAPERGPLWPAWVAVDTMIRESPEEAWRFVLAAMNLDSSMFLLSNLAAGPLEELLVYHGSEIIERVELEAKANPNFALLLGGVWKSEISDEVWRRVELAANRSAWIEQPVA